MGKEDVMDKKTRKFLKLDDAEKVRRFLKFVFAPPDTRPVVARNKECKFTNMVLDHLWREWGVDLIQYSNEVQDAAMDVIDLAIEEGLSVPNTSAKICLEMIAR